MPDGRKQIVTYKVADAYSGYVADVRYEGEGMYKFFDEDRSSEKRNSFSEMIFNKRYI